MRERGFPEEAKADVASDDRHQEKRHDEGLWYLVSIWGRMAEARRT
jgi:hypothetical protein